MQYIEEWYQNKIGQAIRRFRGVITVGQEINHIIGPRSQYAKVILSAEPAEEFIFQAQVVWPQENHEIVIRRAIIDVLMGQPNPAWGIKFTLHEIGYDEVNSSEYSFYTTARAATIAILKGTNNWAE